MSKGGEAKDVVLGAGTGVSFGGIGSEKGAVYKGDVGRFGGGGGGTVGKDLFLPAGVLEVEGLASLRKGMRSF